MPTGNSGMAPDAHRLARSLAHLLFAGLITLSAQAQARLPVAGVAELPDGSPWPHAAVTLLSRPIPEDERIGDADVVTVETDAQGRLETRLLAGRSYTAWAVTATAKGPWLSQVCEDVTAAAPFTLRAEDAPRPRVSVQLNGLDPWRERGEIVVTAISNTTHVITMPCALGEGDSVELPAIPGLGARLQIHCGDRPLFTFARDVSQTEDSSLLVRAPKRVLLRVVDAATLQPIEGAEFAATTNDYRTTPHAIAKTDAEGYAQAELPVGGSSDFRWVNYHLLVRAEGFAPVGSLPTFTVPLDHDAAAARNAGEPVLTIPLRPGRTVTGRVVRDGEPMAGLDMRVVTRIRGLRDASGVTFTEAAWNIRTDADGSFAFASDPREDVVLLALPNPLAGERRAPHPASVLAFLPALDAADLGALDLASCRPTRLRVLDPDGVPAGPGTRVAIGTVDGRTLLGPLPVDRVGELSAMLPQDQMVQICAWSPRGSQRLVLPTGAEHPVAMNACVTVRGEVAKRSGGAAAGVRVRAETQPGRTEENFFARMVRPITTTDDDGRFSMPVYPGLHYRIRYAETPAGWHWFTQPASWSADAPPTEPLLLILR